jgi:hypothetical protein
MNTNPLVVTSGFDEFNVMVVLLCQNAFGCRNFRSSVVPTR